MTSHWSRKVLILTTSGWGSQTHWSGATLRGDAWHFQGRQPNDPAHDCALS